MRGYVRGSFIFVWTLSYLLYILPLVGVFVAMDMPLLASVVFQCVIGFKIVNTGVVAFFVQAISSWGEAVVVTERIEVRTSSINSKQILCISIYDVLDLTRPENIKLYDSLGNTLFLNKYMGMEVFLIVIMGFIIKLYFGNMQLNKKLFC